MNNKKYDGFKLGLDIHGVIDKNPGLFSKISYIVLKNGGEVHILTGEEISDKLVNLLLSFNIYYSKLFSITSYHKTIGTKIEYKNDDLTQPIIENNKWDRTKSIYCIKNSIDLHIDDSEIYEKWFNIFNSSTHYIRYTNNIDKLLTYLFCV